MKLPKWAKPVDADRTHLCECEYGFIAIAKTRLKGFGGNWWYNLCPVCLIYEKEVKQEIGYRQAERWAARLIPLLTLQRDALPTEVKTKAIAAAQVEKEKVTQKDAAKRAARRKQPVAA
jgi:hypothetical protein